MENEDGLKQSFKTEWIALIANVGNLLFCFFCPFNEFHKLLIPI